MYRINIFNKKYQENAINMKYLICGFSGAGKTSLLEKIKNDSQYKEYFFFDLDLEILRIKKFDSISSLIEKVGWDQFRTWEQEVLNALLVHQKCWIALGGGSLTQENSEQFLNDKTIKGLFLDTPLDVCLERIKSSSDRPLLAEGEEFLRNLYKQRLPIYQKFERILDS